MNDGAMGRNDPIYLDYNASAPMKPAVIAAVAEALGRIGNASSVHSFGRSARKAVETARERVASLVGARPEQVVFTASGTEANNHALQASPQRRILVSAIEHDSVLKARPDAAFLPVHGDGRLDLDALDTALGGSPEPALIALMLANNETGVIQPVAEAVDIARRHGALVHCDAIQAAGKIAVDVADLGVATLCLSAHKLGGPLGAGALIVSDPASLAPFIRGGGQEHGLRAGTENVPAIVGFGVAAELARDGLTEFGRLRLLRDALERRIGAIEPGARVFGIEAPRLPNTSKIAMPGVAAETQVIGFDLAGIAVSAGAACSSGKVEPPAVLRAMGIADEIAATAIRVSLGWASSAEDIERFVAAWAKIYARARCGRASATPHVTASAVPVRNPA